VKKIKAGDLLDISNGIIMLSGIILTFKAMEKFVKITMIKF